MGKTIYKEIHPEPSLRHIKLGRVDIAIKSNPHKGEAHLPKTYGGRMPSHVRKAERRP